MIEIKVDRKAVSANIRGNIKSVLNDTAAIISALTKAIFSSLDDGSDIDHCSELLLDLTRDIIKDNCDDRKIELYTEKDVIK